MIALLTTEDILFHAFAIVAVLSAGLVVFVANPIYSALFLALTMSVLAIFYFMLSAPFVAVAQLTVYAGAVMVLFIMVVMLFDLKREQDDLKLSPVMIAKITSAALLCGFLIGVGWLGINSTQNNAATMVAPKVLAQDLDKSKAPTPLVNGPINPDEDLTAAEQNNFVEAKNAEKNPPLSEKQIKVTPEDFGSTASLSKKLFSKYVFAFEAVSLLLLIAIVGTVALAKSKGGTHHVAR